ncbi:MAG: mandelate racemase/muconate lactonizing enzyme family protein, partial [Alphaproteobacteria bacterium]|nr:mandelate racemase/muconate lactonizing enzyme family protein [Alphaproteobacteria bacterium]
MPIRILEVREATHMIASPIRNAYIDFSKMTTSVVAVVTNVVREGKPVIGYGFNSNGRYGQGGLIRERFAARITGADPVSLLDPTGENLDPDKIWAAMMTNEKPGGHGERSVAVGTIDMAVWDAVAKIADKPLFRLLAERHGTTADPRIFVYAAGGYYYPGKDDAALCTEMQSYLDRGYNVLKMKIGGESLAADQRRIEAVLRLLNGQARLAVDANGRFDLETAIAYAKALRPYDLFWYEEAGDPLDFHLQSALAEFYPGAMATGENLFSHQDARNLLRYGGMRPDRDWLQFDCALSYGLCEYLRTLDVVRDAGWSWRRCIPHGGHQLSLAIAAGLGLGGNESYPDVFQPFGGFPDGTKVIDGYVTIPDLPGIGFEAKSDLYPIMRALAE